MDYADRNRYASLSRYTQKNRKIQNVLFEYHKLVYLFKIKNYGTKYIDSNWRIL